MENLQPSGSGRAPLLGLQLRQLGPVQASMQRGKGQSPLNLVSGRSVQVPGQGPILRRLMENKL